MLLEEEEPDSEIQHEDFSNTDSFSEPSTQPSISQTFSQSYSEQSKSQDNESQKSYLPSTQSSNENDMDSLNLSEDEGMLLVSAR